jgi:ribose 5-phosphate isomerase
MRAVIAALKPCGAPVERWSWRAQKAGPQAGQPFITDNGNRIADLHLGIIADPGAVARALKDITGVVEHGLFLGLTHHVIVAADDGTIREYGR